MKKIYPVLLTLIALMGVFMFFQQVEDNTLDPKIAINDGISQYKKSNELSKDDEARVKVELAISYYIAENSKPPASLVELVPKYFEVIPKDSKTGNNFEYKVTGNKYELLSTGSIETTKDSKGNSVSVEDFVNPNTMVIEDYVYDPTDKRDPFKPFTEKEEVLIDEGTPPLLRYDLSQLRVAAILSDSKGGRFAMVEDATGIGYPVRVNDVIGIHKGKVLSIDADKMDILEITKDAAGQEKQELVTIKLVSGGDDAKNLKNRPKPKRKKK